jgi:hypothetical protein
MGAGRGSLHRLVRCVLSECIAQVANCTGEIDQVTPFSEMMLPRDRQRSTWWSRLAKSKWIIEPVGFVSRATVAAKLIFGRGCHGDVQPNPGPIRSAGETITRPLPSGSYLGEVTSSLDHFRERFVRIIAHESPHSTSCTQKPRIRRQLRCHRVLPHWAECCNKCIECFVAQWAPSASEQVSHEVGCASGFNV